MGNSEFAIPSAREMRTIGGTERDNICTMDAKFPLSVFEKDDRSMYLVESPERVLDQLEAIDIENDEYLFRDSSEAGIRISGIAIGQFCSLLSPIPLAR